VNFQRSTEGVDKVKGKRTRQREGHAEISDCRAIQGTKSSRKKSLTKEQQKDD